MKLLRDFLRYFALDSEHVFEVAIVLFRPDVRVSAGVNQLDVYVKPGTSLTDATFQHMGYAQLIADLRRVMLITIQHHASSAYNLKMSNLGQLGQKIVLDSVGK